MHFNLLLSPLSSHHDRTTSIVFMINQLSSGSMGISPLITIHPTILPHWLVRAMSSDDDRITWVRVRSAAWFLQSIYSMSPYAKGQKLSLLLFSTLMFYFTPFPGSFHFSLSLLFAIAIGWSFIFRSSLLNWIALACLVSSGVGFLPSTLWIRWRMISMVCWIFFPLFLNVLFLVSRWIALFDLGASRILGHHRCFIALWCGWCTPLVGLLPFLFAYFSYLLVDNLHINWWLCVCVGCIVGLPYIIAALSSHWWVLMCSGVKWYRVSRSH